MEIFNKDMKYIMKSPFENIEYEKLLEWHHKFNTYEWPADFVFPPPEGWNEMNHHLRHGNIAFTFVCESFERFVCRYDTLKYLHCVIGFSGYNEDTKSDYIEIKTEEEFDMWWNKTFKNL